jgi:hypothetical protein
LVDARNDRKRLENVSAHLLGQRVELVDNANIQHQKFPRTWKLQKLLEAALDHLKKQFVSLNLDGRRFVC